MPNFYIAPAVDINEKQPTFCFGVVPPLNDEQLARCETELGLDNPILHEDSTEFVFDEHSHKKRDEMLSAVQSMLEDEGHTVAVHPEQVLLGSADSIFRHLANTNSA